MAVQVGELVFKMAADVARLQTDMQKARGTVDNAMQGIKGAASVAKAALGAVGVALTAGSFVSMIKGGIDAMDTMYKLAQRTGNTVEALSSLKPAARAAGLDFEAAALSMGKLAKNMLEAADTGKGKAAQAFDELGIKVTDANGKLRPTVEVMKEAADKLAAMEDKTRAVALAQEIFGRSGAALMPFLQELAKQAELHASMTTKETEEAHKFNVELDEMLARSSKLARQAASGLLPALIDILGAFSETTKSGADVRSFFGALGDLLRYVALVANGVVTAFRLAGEAIAATLALMDRVQHLDFRGALSVMASAAEESKKILDNASATADRINGIKRPDEAAPGGGKTVEARAAGGPVSGGQTYLVGENGPELFTPSASGSVIPNVKGIAQDLGVSASTVTEVGRAFEQAAQRAVKSTNDWRSAIRGLATDLLKMAAKKLGDQAVSGISSAVGSIFSSMVSGGGDYVEARAAGGPVSSGSTYLVGENGPELFTPGSSGGITPNGAMGGGDLHLNIDATGADPATLNRVMAEIRALKASFNGRSVAAIRSYLANRGSSLAA